MSNLEQLANAVALQGPAGYQHEGPPASEPVAWSALALAACGRSEAATRGAVWLAELQAEDGSVGVTLDQRTPGWPTSLALLAWSRVDRNRFEAQIARATAWALAAQGETTPRKPQIGHDTTLVGWSWAADTHSWLEPTAFFVMGLSATGSADHPRVREGVRLLADRLLPSGGANYGNTIVLGQELLPHAQPSGIALWALAAHQIDDPRIGRTIDYLKSQLEPNLAASSLAFAALGLKSVGAATPECNQLLEAAAKKLAAAGASPYRRALVLNALCASNDGADT